MGTNYEQPADPIVMSLQVSLNPVIGEDVHALAIQMQPANRATRRSFMGGLEAEVDAACGCLPSSPKVLPNRCGHPVMARLTTNV